ncbi:Uma2 family endonuclease [Haliscomenobacter hydrossis]|uniref:Putative restriction endonuclease domain-containing protein n=1 Tax=Haliscomenobacter hydrossis (strain ATCC 27775 / DSM 1100 / LMG 10767 / O) TaxID=760192 RepID=F4L791_HALH1|nr:Uma2 family endonuclease [Haliscomenobacter hydrossis]AEE53118.1 protein of unknown function DUF820 [Haliscomenobacter hydrossis DSM 1100]
MSIQIQRHLFTIADYHKMGAAGILPERGIELINGEIIKMSPIGSKHAAKVDKLGRLLNEQLSKALIVRSQNPFIANDLSEPEPDIALLKYRDDFYENELPHGTDIHLIIEVADTTFAYDTKVKLPLYASSGIPEYWVIDLNKKQVHVYWDALENSYQLSKVYRSGELIKAQGIELELEVAQVI